MKLVMCKLLVTLAFGAPYKGAIQSYVAIEGVVLKETPELYVVNFSKEAREKHYRGDYSSVVIGKTECIDIELEK